MANHLFGNPRINSALIIAMMVIGAALERVP